MAQFLKLNLCVNLELEINVCIFNENNFVVLILFKCTKLLSRLQLPKGQFLLPYLSTFFTFFEKVRGNNKL